jgi:hypothetical protein
MLTAAVLLLPACGSQSRVQSRPAPRLPRTVATKLAARSDALASALRTGDGCAAKIQMHGLERQTRLAISSGRIPAPFRTRLLAAVGDLAGRMPSCVPPPPPPPPSAVVQQPAPKHGKNKKEHGEHDKGKKKHGKGTD